MNLAQRLFIDLAMHARIHDHLDRFDTRYRRMLAEIERKEIVAYDDPVTFEKLETLKQELLQIRFKEKG